MAFVVKTRPKRFEIRESRTTAAGPRSRTLASFSRFDDSVLAKATARAEKPLDAETLRKAAARAGASVAGAPADEAARELLRALGAGGALEPMLRDLLLDALGPCRPKAPPVSDAARAASEWIGTDATERGEALRQLLLLADALPSPDRDPEIDFPRLDSDPG
jgi:hypothetical protein